MLLLHLQKKYKVRRIFQNNKLEQEITQNGFVVIDLFSDDEIQSLTSLFNQYSFEITEDFHSTHFSNKRAYKKEVNAVINRVIEQKTIHLFEMYQPIFSNFMVKNPSSKSIMPLHADWTYVDENTFRSFACWIPLVDTTFENGALGIVPNSHLFPINWRGPRIPSPFHAFNEYIIQNYGKVIPMKKGQCVVYDHRLLHFSPPNLSSLVRPAINVVFTPKEASIYHYMQTENAKETFKFEISNFGFFTEYEHFEFPDNKNFNTIHQEITPFSKGEIDRIFLKKRGLWKSIKRLFARA